MLFHNPGNIFYGQFWSNPFVTPLIHLFLSGHSQTRDDPDTRQEFTSGRLITFSASLSPFYPTSFHMTMVKI